MKFPEDENNNIKKCIERNLLKRIKEQLKKILKWHKIYKKHLSIFFPDLKLLFRRPSDFTSITSTTNCKNRKKSNAAQKKLKRRLNNIVPVLFAKTTEFSIALQ